MTPKQKQLKRLLKSIQSLREKEKKANRKLTTLLLKSDITKTFDVNKAEMRQIKKVNDLERKIDKINNKIQELKDQIRKEANQ